MPTVLSVLKKDGNKRSHLENRRIVCSCCGLKNLKCIPVNSKLEDLIKKFVHCDYNLDIISYPSGMNQKYAMYGFLQ